MAQRDSPRILHVVSGFTPWLFNGLVIYAEELMAAQVRHGASVACFFPGRHYPFVRKPRLHRWSRRAVSMYEWLSSPIVVGALRGTASPEADLDHPLAEETFAEVLRDFRPDVVHAHDLGGLPSSLVNVTHAAGLPFVFTIHDYFLLCPLVRLYDVDGTRCMRTRPGSQCAKCCADAPRDNLELRDRTIGFEGIRARRLLPGLDSALRHPAAGRAVADAGRWLARLGSSGDDGGGPTDLDVRPTRPPAAPPEAYQRRRDVNVERLNAMDVIIAYSRRSAEIYETLGVDPQRIRRVRISAGHLPRLRPSRVAGATRPLTFAVLNVMMSPQKGADVVLGALRILGENGGHEGFRLLVAGWVPPHVESELRRYPAVEIHGLYQGHQLSALLDGVDVGILPSVWEDVHPFVGPEFLAKGIPIVANALGGMTEYTREGATGWLNHANSAEGLAAIIADIMRQPEQVSELSRRIIAARDEIIRPMDEHIREMEEIYRHLVPRRAWPMVERCPSVPSGAGGPGQRSRHRNE